MTTVSVIIATWNRSASLQRAVRSALAQSHSPLEVLVCGDGCTDDSREVIDAIGDSRVIWLPAERAGRPAVPRNRGIGRSSGEWLAFLDDDDVWLPEKLELQLREAYSSRCDAVCSDAWRVRPGAAPGAEALLGGKSTLLRFPDLLRENRVICSSMLVRREVVAAAAGFPEDERLRALEDYALWLRIADATDIAYLARPLLNYTDVPQGSIRKDSISEFEQRQLVMKSFLAWKGLAGGISTNSLRLLACLLREKVRHMLGK
ncbi:glycosyltransferase [Geomonas paludis]|uniref:Glycosyl transferase n=1 Tax=Geomonas paludis TaxID=2740185 RepID=A0A6V8MWA6_9BACT|nr:glycosyltransferase [Geomonas paludis]UPU34377.1 glycosyltransferase [Geomonas paludis]GFO64362.1 glycosyl transferase [Geomonas paludis]